MNSPGITRRSYHALEIQDIDKNFQVIPLLRTFTVSRAADGTTVLEAVPLSLMGAASLQRDADDLDQPNLQALGNLTAPPAWNLYQQFRQCSGDHYSPTPRASKERWVGQPVPQNSHISVSTVGGANASMYSLVAISDICGIDDHRFHRRQRVELTVDKKSSLPVRLRVQWVDSLDPRGQTQPVSTGHLQTVSDETADYNLDFPPSVLQFAVPAVGPILDKRGGLVPANRALSVGLSVVERDPSGTVHVRLDHRIGGQPSDEKVLKQIAAVKVGSAQLTDDVQTAYTTLNGPGIVTGDREDYWFAPINPLGPKHASPTRITIDFLLVDDRRSYFLTSALPAVKTNLEFCDRARWPTGYSIPTLEEQTAVARAHYYSRGADASEAHASEPVGASPWPLQISKGALPTNAERHRAAMWWTVAATEAKRRGNRVLAQRYQWNSSAVEKDADAGDDLPPDQ